MPTFKAGATRDGLLYEITSKFDDIDAIHKKMIRREAIITSARDGAHMKNSLHYKGRAIDLRIYDMPMGVAQKVVTELKNKLGRNYDIVLEHDHIHLEYDPK